MSNRSSAKKPNVYYAQADGGIELPVIDVTNPEFALVVGPAEQRAIVETYARRRRPWRFMQRDSTMPLVMRGHAAFAPLAARAGWKIARVIERIVSDQVALVRDV